MIAYYFIFSQMKKVWEITKSPNGKVKGLLLLNYKARINRAGEQKVVCILHWDKEDQADRCLCWVEIFKWWEVFIHLGQHSKRGVISNDKKYTEIFAFPADPDSAIAPPVPSKLWLSSAGPPGTFCCCIVTPLGICDTYWDHPDAGSPSLLYTWCAPFILYLVM